MLYTPLFCDKSVAIQISSNTVDLFIILANILFLRISFCVIRLLTSLQGPLLVNVSTQQTLCERIPYVLYCVYVCMFVRIGCGRRAHWPHVERIR